MKAYSLIAFVAAFAGAATLRAQNELIVGSLDPITQDLCPILDRNAVLLTGDGFAQDGSEDANDCVVQVIRLAPGAPAPSAPDAAGNPTGGDALLRREMPPQVFHTLIGEQADAGLFSDVFRFTDWGQKVYFRVWDKKPGAGCWRDSQVSGALVAGEPWFFTCTWGDWQCPCVDEPLVAAGTAQAHPCDPSQIPIRLTTPCDEVVGVDVSLEFASGLTLVSVAKGAGLPDPANWTVTPTIDNTARWATIILTYTGAGAGIGPSAIPVEILSLQLTVGCPATGTLAVSFVNGHGSPAVNNIVRIRGGTTKAPQLQNGSVSVTAPDPVTNLSCTAVDCSTVDLAWTLGGTYDSIRVRRDAADIATLAGGALNYRDSSSTPGGRSYAVIGIRGSLSSTPATCNVTVPTCAPTIASVAPAQGPTSGGTAATIAGTNFQAGATVTFGGTPATNVVVVSSAQITCQTPAQAAGAVDVVVRNPDGQTATRAGGFTYLAPPSIASVAPTQGPTTGGTAVTIAGTDFQTGATVTFGGAAAASVVVVSPTQITCTTPAHAAGAVDVVVRNPDGQTATRAGGFTYVAPPTIGTVTPGQGPALGGTAVTIGGTDFQTGATVTFGGAAATSVVVVSPTQITCTTPARAAGFVNVVVRNPDAQTATATDAFEYVAAPTVSGIAPAQGPTGGGTPVAIAGTGFRTGATVTFGGAAATSVVVTSSTQVLCVTPAHAAGAVDVVVRNTDTQTGTLAGGFTYLAPPSVTSVTPAQGPAAGGTAAAIGGSGFQAGATVTFGGAAATNVVVVSQAQITCTTPSHAAGAVDVVVRNPDAQTGTLPGGFTYVAGPSVTSVTPAQGPALGGTAAAIGGSGFQAGATVTFGGTAATNVVVVPPAQITCTTPAHAAGAVDVIVRNPDAQTGTLPGGFTYVAAPTIASLAPREGPASGGTAATIGGSGFQAGATVRFGGTAATSVVVVSPAQITCVTPAGAPGLVNLEVENPDGQKATAVNFYQYVGPPVVTSVTPTQGPLSGGTPVTIGGSGFLAGATVTFGGSAATSVAVVSSTQITCATPAHAAGAVDVVVRNTDAQTGTLAAGFTYVAGPTIASVDPRQGPTTGGTAVTIGGTGFQAGATVRFGGTAATGVNVGSPSQITCTTPAHTAGLVSVEVENPDGQKATAANAFEYVAAPTAGGVAPAQGPTSGGTSVTVAGTGFRAGASVLFGGEAATNVSVLSSTQITCTTPAHGAGPVTVEVRNSDGQSGTLAGGFTFMPPPSVSSVAPAEGPTTGGTAVSIGGTEFRSGATVTFGGVAATSVDVVSAAQITCATPPHAAGLVDVVVRNPDGQTGTRAGGFRYYEPLTIAGISPSSGPEAGGTAVEITGTGFLAGATVTIGGGSASSVAVVSLTRITCATPAHAAGFADVVVANPDGRTATRANGFEYLAAPSIATISPASGPEAGGTLVRITGTGFRAGAAVRFGGAAAGGVNVISATELTCSAPAHAPGLVDVEVQNPDGQKAVRAGGYTYTTNAGITSVTPASGPTAGGTSVAIAGAGFVSGATVTFGGIAATNIVVVSATRIDCRTPAHGAGVVDVTVTNPDLQSATLPSAYEYIPPPTVGSVSPASGPTAGGTPVQVAGTGFRTGATVRFGTAAAVPATFISSTALGATTPAHAAGAVTVTVTNPDGQVGARDGAFEYIPPPQVASISPASGPTAGGTPVVVLGSGFRSGAAVLFGTVAGEDVVVVSATRITCATPPHPGGAVDVVVRNMDGQSATLTSGFQYIAAPSIASLTPREGPITGGTRTTILGSGFQPGADVTFGGYAANEILIVSAGEITCRTPSVPAAGAVAVQVRNPDGQRGTLAGGFTYFGAPDITSVQPPQGPVTGGTLVTIAGAGFRSGAAVTFDGISATNITVVSSTQITCRTPAHAAGLVAVAVAIEGGLSKTLASAYQYVAGPAVQSVAPASGPTGGGTRVTIQGENFKDGAAVRFGGTPATQVMVASSTTLLCTAPAHDAGRVAVAVENSDGQSSSLADAFEYIPPPRVLSVAPGSGPAAGGTAATIDGESFRAGAAVAFGGVAATNVTLVSATRLTCTTPAHAPGIVAVQVTNADSQSSSLPGAFEYIPPPEVSGITPASGPTAGGTAVEIAGAGFRAGAVVLFGGASASNVVIASATRITCTTPVHGAGLVAVLVRNTDGQEAALANGFQYVGPPILSSVAPSSGSVAGGTAVALAGGGFQAGASVTFGGASATNIVVVSDARITCTTPAHAAGPVDVIVRNPDTQTAALPAGFLYVPPPRIDRVVPALGPAAGGTPVTIQGAAFQTGAQVFFGGTAATGVVVATEGVVQCMTPAHAAGAVDVSVRNPDGQQGVLASGYAYQPGPFISSIAPASGPTAGGTVVAILGGAFGTGAAVLFGDTPAAAVTVVSATEIRATTPARPAGAADVTVRNPDGQSAVRASGFTFFAPPSIDRLDPAGGPAKGGIWVSLYGSGFRADAKVFFGDVAATLVIVVSGTEITCLAPPYPAGGRVDVRVRNVDGQEGVLAGGFFYTPPPQVIRVVPASGPASGGTAVTIEGRYFQNQAKVSFGTAPAVNVVVATAEIIQCVTPPYVPGPANVTVRNPDGEEWVAPLAFFFLAEFRRGDCNIDGSVNVSDAVMMLRYLFDETLAAVPTCDLACDANGSDHVTVSDAVYLLLFLFGGGAPPDGGIGCRPIPEGTVLGCRAYGACR